MSNLVGCYCPMGCGETLYTIFSGIRCASENCPRPNAAHEILNDSETEHVVKFEEASFSVKHPLRERLGGDLFACELHEKLRMLEEAPVPPGKYRVFLGENGKWGFVKL